MSVSFNSAHPITDFSFVSLEPSHVLPSKEEAKKIFYALGDDFWKQIIDGKYHDFGKMVFDENLHYKTREPGFYASLEKGCEFASAYLTDPLSLDFYKNLHGQLCSHFAGEATSTELTLEEVGRFSNRTSWCKLGIEVMDEGMKELENDYKIVERYEFSYLEDEKVKQSYPTSVERVNQFEEKVKEKIQELNKEIADRCQELCIPVLAKLELIPRKWIFVSYEIDSLEEQERITQLLFDSYNQQIDRINTNLKKPLLPKEIEQIKKEKIGLIAHLFQMLEWLHPFYDGQGRTDLVLNTKLLTEQGLNPAILDEPYLSTWSPLAKWSDYLAEGIQKWQAEADRIQKNKRQKI